MAPHHPKQQNNAAPPPPSPPARRIHSRRGEEAPVTAAAQRKQLLPLPKEQKQKQKRRQLSDASESSSAAEVGAPYSPLSGRRNILNVVLGDILFRTWYPSFYPEELVGKEGMERLYVCRWCFKYAKEVEPFLRHTMQCPLREAGPPGKPIYAKAPYSVYEVDGESHKLFAQNLSLFAKLFLDNKSVFFDVVGFNYYLLIHDPTPQTPYMQPIGFFSKEKMSWDNNNLACILVFPPWQRKGLGKILMGVSYELSRREGRIGGPEKPLSELGRRGYLRFWEARVASEVLTCRTKSSLTVEELAARCSMLADDVVAALKEMALCETRRKGDGITVSKARVRQWAAAKAIDLAPPVDEEAFLEVWVPDEESEDE